MYKIRQITLDDSDNCWYSIKYEGEDGIIEELGREEMLDLLKASVLIES